MGVGVFNLIKLRLGDDKKEATFSSSQGSIGKTQPHVTNNKGQQEKSQNHKAGVLYPASSSSLIQTGHRSSFGTLACVPRSVITKLVSLLQRGRVFISTALFTQNLIAVAQVDDFFVVTTHAHMHLTVTK